MTQKISPLASGTVLDEEQGGTGVNADDLVLNSGPGYVIGTTGTSPGVVFGPARLIAGSGLTIDSSVANRFTFTASQVALTIRNVSATDNILVTDNVIRAAAGGAGITLTLPAASLMTGKQIIVKKISGAGSVTIDGNSTNIDGASTYVLDNAFQSATLLSFGTGWNVI